MRLMVLSVLMVLACICGGCGSVAKNATDAAPPLDTPQPDASPEPRCNSTQPFLNPTLVPNVNSSSNDSTPRLSADELEMFFASDRPGGMGAYDLYVAKRASSDADFGTPEPIRELNTAGGEYAPFLERNNLTLYYHGALDIFVTRRPTVMNSFGMGVPVAGINSPQDDDSSPYLTQSDQVIYFPSSRSGNYDIYRSTRDSSGAFGTPMPVTEINVATAVDAEPAVSVDGLTIYWSTDRAIPGTAEIWVATRPSTSAAFASPMRHGTLNTTPSSYDVPGWISADNCDLYL